MLSVRQGPCFVLYPWPLREEPGTWGSTPPPPPGGASPESPGLAWDGTRTDNFGISLFRSTERSAWILIEFAFEMMDCLGENGHLHSVLSFLENNLLRSSFMSFKIPLTLWLDFFPSALWFLLLMFTGCFSLLFFLVTLICENDTDFNIFFFYPETSSSFNYM